MARPVPRRYYILPLRVAAWLGAACLFGAGFLWFSRTGGWAHAPLSEYFNSGLDGWISGTVHTIAGQRRLGSGSWNCGDFGAEPGVLRLWKPTRGLTDYDLIFRARINTRAVGWVFRASDASTFLGIKLIAGGSRSEVEHMLSVGGEIARSRAPAPVALAEGVDMAVRLSVRGSTFVTTVDGEVVDIWNNTRLPRGAVGFFSEPGESSYIRWATLTRPTFR